MGLVLLVRANVFLVSQDCPNLNSEMLYRSSMSDLISLELSLTSSQALAALNGSVGGRLECQSET